MPKLDLTRKIWYKSDTMIRNIVMALTGALVPVVCAAEPVAQSVELAVGQSMTVTLPGNPTTGFVWSVAECADVVQVELAFEQKAPQSGPPLCGSPRATVVTLTGQKAGQGSVKLIYARPWEKGTAPAATRILNVTVK